MKTLLTVARSQQPPMIVDTCAEGDVLHVIVGVDAETSRLRIRLLNDGLALNNIRLGSLRWTEIVPVEPRETKVERDHGEVTLHDHIRCERMSDGAVRRDRIRQTWRR